MAVSSIINAIIVFLSGSAVTGFITLYTATSKKTKLDLENQSKVIENYQKIIDGYEKKMEAQEQRFIQYEARVDDKIESFKERFAKVEAALNISTQANSCAYRCTLPAKIEDCPVIAFLKVNKKKEGE